MGAVKHIKAALKAKKISQIELAHHIDKPLQSVYNQFHRDAMSFETLETYADAIGCDVVLIDRETGETY